MRIGEQRRSGNRRTTDMPATLFGKRIEEPQQLHLEPLPSRRKQQLSVADFHHGRMQRPLKSEYHYPRADIESFKRFFPISPSERQK